MTDTAVPAKPSSAAAWKKQAQHEVTLPSGAEVTIKLPNLAKMVKAGSLPNELLDTAIKTAQPQQTKIDADALKESWAFVTFILPETVIKPKITTEDVDDLPVEDVEMLMSFVQRTADMDAVGHQLGGLEKLKSFRDLRGIWTADEVVGGIEGVEEPAADVQ